MGAIPGGVGILGFIAPKDDADPIAVIDPVYGIGGVREVADSTVRNAITTERRRFGMIVHTADTDRYWKLKAAPWVGDDTDWVLLNISSTQSAYTHEQTVPALTWTINHGLGYRPSVQAVDTTGDQITGSVDWPTENQVTITFLTVIAGKAYLS